MNKTKYFARLWKKLHREERGDFGATLLAGTCVVFLLSVSAGWVYDNLSQCTYVKGDNRYVDATRALDWATGPEPAPADPSQDNSKVVIQGPVFTKIEIRGNIDPETYKRYMAYKIRVIKGSSETQKQPQTGLLHEAEHWVNAQQDMLPDESSAKAAEQSQNAQISKQLKAVNVTADALNIDIYKAVENLVSESAIPGLAADALSSLTSDVVKSVLRNTAPGTSAKTVQAVSDKLNQQKALATQDLINQRKNLQLLQQAKQEYEQRVTIINDMLSQGDSAWAKNLVDYKNDRRILDDLNSKIADSEAAVSSLEEKLGAAIPDKTSPQPATLPVTAPPSSRPVINSFTANPSSISAGGSSTLSWNVSDAMSVSIGGTPVLSQGSSPVKPGSSTIYTLTAANDAGSVSKSVTVTVTAAVPAVANAPVINSFTANPDSIALGEGTTLWWSTSGATEVYLDGNPVSAEYHIGFFPTQTHRYVLTARNAAGATVSRNLTVTVAAQQEPQQSAKGSLKIGSVPAGADIYINGQKQNYQTTVNFTNVEAGTYTVGLKKAGYKDYSATAIVADGRLTELWAKLEAIQSTPTPTPSPQPAPADDDQGPIKLLPDNW
jgi:hypothetical protein